MCCTFLVDSLHLSLSSLSDMLRFNRVHFSDSVSAGLEIAIRYGVCVRLKQKTMFAMISPGSLCVCCTVQVDSFHLYLSDVLRFYQTLICCNSQSALLLFFFFRFGLYRSQANSRWGCVCLCVLHCFCGLTFIYLWCALVRSDSFSPCASASTGLKIASHSNYNA